MTSIERSIANRKLREQLRGNCDLYEGYIQRMEYNHDRDVRMWHERIDNQALMHKQVIAMNEHLVKEIASGRAFLLPAPIYFCAGCGKDLKISAA